MGIEQKLFHKILYSSSLKRIAYNILRNETISANKFYLYLYNRKISGVISRYKTAPQTVKIENTNACNARCITCPRDKMTRPLGFMAEDLFQGIIGQCKGLNIPRINLHGFGEPLIDKNFIQKVRYARSHLPSAHLATNTNASLLKPDISENIVKAGLDEVVISLDAAQDETYAQIRRNLNLKKVEQNILDFIKIRESLHSRKPILTLDFVSTELNKHEAQLFENKWRNLADNVCISFSHDWAGNVADIKVRPGSQRIPCRFLWTEMVISWDGRVALCCQDYQNAVELGDLKKNSLAEIWEGKAVNFYRRKHLARDFAGLNLCRDCNFLTFWWLFQ